MNGSVNAYIKAANVINEAVWYSGTDALKEGEAVCYNTDYGTAATAATASRGNRVERPSTSNNMAFAGVCARSYKAQSGGQRIEIYVPGSKGVKVALGVNTVIDTGLLSFCVSGKYDVGVSGGDGDDGGRFYTGKYVGRGSAVPRQTVAAAVLEASMTGAWSLAADGITLTVSSTTDISAGDTVVLLGGADDGTDTVVPGKYEVSSITSPTVLVLTASAQAVAAGGTSALTCTGYCYTGNPTCIADLLTGDESGGAEFVSPPNTGGAAVMSYMVGGWSYICGGVTVGSAVANGPLAESTIFGFKKGFGGLGTLTTHGATINPATNGYQFDHATALDLITIDAADEVIVLEWNGIWVTRGFSGATEE